MRGFRPQEVGSRKRREVEEREVRYQVWTLSQVQLGQGCRMRGTGESMDGGVRFHSTGGVDQYYPLTIGMEGATE